MKNRNFSEPICFTPTGWFRYNYYAQQLEFISNSTRQVVYAQAIPVDEWEAITAKQAYCQSIINEKARQQQKQQLYIQNEKNKQEKIFYAAAAIAVISGSINGYWFLNDTIVDYRLETFIAIIFAISFAVASSAYHKK